MSHKSIIQKSLIDAFDVIETIDGTVVTTQCVYPSSDFVRVYVRGGEGTFYVSDDGGAVHELEAAGADVKNPERMTSAILSPLGLSMTKGVIRSPSVGQAELGIAIALVANASRSAADWLFSHLKVQPHNQKFKEIVAHYLRNQFRDSVREEVLIGNSNKPHTFDNILYLSGNRRLIIDPVLHDANSINSRVIANLDVKAADYVDVEQRIVYDDAADWTAAELNVLQLGAIAVPYSSVPRVLQRMAAQ